MALNIRKMEKQLMNISFKEWLYKESAQSDAVENLKNSLLELTDKSKYDLVVFFQKALITPKDKIKDIEFPHTAYHSNLVEDFKNKKFSEENDKNNGIAKLLKNQPLKSIYALYRNFDQSKKEKFKNNNLEFFIKEAQRDFMALAYTIPEVLGRHTDNFHVDENDFDFDKISWAFVNPFSYLNKENKYKIQDFIDLSNEEFIQKIKEAALGKDNKLNIDHINKKSREISGYGGDDEKSSIADIAVAGSNSLDPRSRRVIKRRSGETMLSFPSNDYEYEYDDSESESESNYESKYVLSDDEFNKFKKIIHEEISKDELKKFVFCTREGLEFDKLLVPNYYTDIYEIIRNQNRLKSLRGNGKYDQIYEIIRNMIESSDINEKRKGIKLWVYLGGDEQGNFVELSGRGKDQFTETIKSKYAEVITKIVSKSKFISDDPRWQPILKKWKSK